jgi:hypothetical protein
VSSEYGLEGEIGVPRPRSRIDKNTRRERCDVRRADKAETELYHTIHIKFLNKTIGAIVEYSW